MGGTVNLDEMIALPNEAGNGGPRDITQESANWRAAVYGRLGVTATKTTSIEVQQLREFGLLKAELEKVKIQLRTLQYAPARILQGTSTTNATTTTRRGSVIEDGVPMPEKQVTLCKSPKLFSVLWTEWIEGIGGRTPASQFSSLQRGRVKTTYSQRKPFWMCMERLIDNGFTAQASLRKIMQAYPTGNLTDKLKLIGKDENRGGNTSLCPFAPPVSRAEQRRRSGL